MVRNLLAVSLTLLGLSQLSLVQEISMYVLPLQHLHWVGYGLLMITFLTWLTYQIDIGSLIYIKYGIPIAGRVKKVYSGMDVDPDFPELAIPFCSIDVEFRNPESSRMESKLFDLNSLSLKRDQDITKLFARGEYIILVARRRQIHRTSEIYSLLNLHDIQNEIPKKIDHITTSQVWKQRFEKVRYCIEASAPFLSLFTSLIVMSSVQILDVQSIVPIVFMSVGSFIGFFSGVRFLKQQIANPRSPIFEVFGYDVFDSSRNDRLPLPLSMSSIVDRQLIRVYYCGGGTIVGLFQGLIFFLVSNHYLDRAESKFVPMTELSFSQETFNGIFRTFHAEFKLSDNSNKLKSDVSLRTLHRFDSTSYGLLEAGQGYWGVETIRGLHPVKWIAIKDHDTSTGPVYVINAPTSDTEREQMIRPVIELPDQNTMPIPAQLLLRVEQEKKRLAPSLKRVW